MKFPHPLEPILAEHAPALCQAAQSGPHAAMVAIRRLVTAIRPVSGPLADAITSRVSALGLSDPTRRQATPPPMDPMATTSGAAMPWETRDCSAANEPVLTPRIAMAITELIDEHRRADRLQKAGLTPRATLLLIGPPGVGKTMLASWIACRLEIPLLQIQLSQAISSFFGRTGSNLTEAIQWARRERCVLLFDEFDALAKRRDDPSDIGELKRIVSVLLKELEEWRGPSLIIAATNHPDLIDPAIFRRFDLSVTLENPDAAQAEAILRQHLAGALGDAPVIAFAAQVLAGSSGSTLRTLALRVRRHIALDDGAAPDRVLLQHLAEHVSDRTARKAFVRRYRAAFPQARLSDMADLLGVAIGTIHSDLKGAEGTHA